VKTPQIIDDLYALIAAAETPISSADLAAATGHSHAYITRVATHLYDEGRILRSGGGRQGYRWTAAT
jgi:DNA-binding IscR family transcriptional regulator